MSVLVPRLDWRGGYDDLIIHRWDEDGHILFDLAYQDGRTMARATQAFHRYEESGYPVAAPGCFWIKNYSEHKGLGDALVKAGVVERTGRTVAYGPFDASSDEYRFTDQYKDEEKTS